MDSEIKRFSIILVSYNVEKYIGEAIESVLNQSYKNFELIIVDDCSTDNTRKNIRKYKDERIKFYKTKKNTGTASGSRNVGLEYVTGEYILFLDGDDKLLDNEILRKIDLKIGKEEYDLIYLGYQDLGNEYKLRVSNEQNSTKEARIICDVSFSVSARCWNRKFIEKHNMRFIEGMYYEDELFCMKANILAEKTTYGEFPIFNYRRNRKGSAMTTPSLKKCSDWYRMLSEMVKLLEITPDEYKKYLISFLKNENDSIPYRIKAILQSFDPDKNGVPVFPKRNYEFVDFMGENNDRNN